MPLLLRQLQKQNCIHTLPYGYAGGVDRAGNGKVWRNDSRNHGDGLGECFQSMASGWSPERKS